MVEDPQVSVVMPVYNAVSFVELAVDSILGQSLSDFEFIVVDDGSTDSSGRLLENMANKDRRISVYRNETNIGYRKSLNIGLKMARGKYVARMDADDISLPKRLELQLNFLEAHNDVGVLGTDAYIVDMHGKVMGQRCVPPSHGPIMWTMCFTSPLIHPSVMFRRKMLRDIGGYNSRVFAEDYDLWWRLSHFTMLHNLNIKLFLLRKHKGNQTFKHRDRYLESSSIIAKEVVKELLGKEVELSQVENLWHQSNLTTEEVLAAGNLLVDLCESLKSNVSFKEYKYIRSETSKRLFRLVKYKKFHPGLWSLIAVALRLNPLVGIDFLRSLKYRVYYRYLTNFHYVAR